MNDQGSRVLYQDERAEVVLAPLYVVLRVPTTHRIASFAPYHGGLWSAHSVAIHEVKNHDLPEGFDPLVLLASRMSEVDAKGVGMLTSRSVSSAQIASSSHEQNSARVLVTAGLSNAVRVGDSPGPLDGWGTINMICHVDVPLGDGALLEALSILAEARTCAVLEAGVPSRRSGAAATGTGTDCIAILAPERARRATYAGKHTAIGHIVGAAAHQAVAAALAVWKSENPP